MEEEKKDDLSVSVSVVDSRSRRAPPKNVGGAKKKPVYAESGEESGADSGPSDNDEEEDGFSGDVNKDNKGGAPSKKGGKTESKKAPAVKGGAASKGGKGKKDEPPAKGGGLKMAAKGKAKSNKVMFTEKEAYDRVNNAFLNIILIGQRLYERKK